MKVHRVGLVAAMSVVLLQACGGPADALSEEGGTESERVQLGEAHSELSVSGYTVSLNIHGGTGGGAGSLACASGYVVVGFYGRAWDYVERFGLICAFLNADGTLGSQYSTGYVGGTGGSDFGSIKCPTNMAAVGVRGRATTFVDRFGLYCSGISNWRTYGTVQAVTGTAGGSGGIAFENDMAPVGYVLTSFNTWAVAYVDRLQGVASFISP
ncbi:hypothetical protein KRR26_35905 [Corallococcus sp. M34]|uniref:hypothetical protein n=1 Tax=Citreicoccus inhibens TaxID=2849499 RepID=UPI001C220FFA|nr:hypothetical protein [Citreicoccus inhibens]MBU8900994.1 hypothetical protein [Citreicoccus inhibens]